jgi:hypothetical protein
MFHHGSLRFCNYQVNKLKHSCYMVQIDAFKSVLQFGLACYIYFININLCGSTIEVLLYFNHVMCSESNFLSNI